MKLLQGLKGLSLIFELRSLSQTLEQKLMGSEPFQENGLDFRQYCCIELVHRNKDIGVNDLASYLNCTQPAVTQILKKLEKKGFIKKDQFPSDHRRHRLKLGPKATRFIAEIQPFRLQLEQSVAQTMKSLNIDLVRVLNVFESSILQEEEYLTPVFPSLIPKKERVLKLIENKSSVDHRKLVELGSEEDIVNIIYCILSSICSDKEIKLFIENINIKKLIENGFILIQEDDSIIISEVQIGQNSSELFILSGRNFSRVDVIDSFLEDFLEEKNGKEEKSLYCCLSSEQESLIKILLKYEFDIIASQKSRFHYGNLILKKTFF